MTQALRRAGRTLLQLVAAGGLTALVSTLADGLTATQAGLVVMGWGVVVTYVQNLLEDSGAIPPVLGTKPDASFGTSRSFDTEDLP